ncbi:hypothetical protein OE88DRAFT_1652003 [Heliocybe sulcata]|uniref:INO80 complex subunit F domain-containing protein n=1 Tax=Heliocybe sulcata TaxID=5364 RepID=A0A5C3NE57_9AGAM|nr:hypothetical protein OE88DRAFT_1652003 [Heliocybe sulcata]
MSRQPSPGPSQPSPYGHVLQPPAPTHASRQKSRAYATAVAAGAEDIKYQLKYKELKRKVKEIEVDNDKLYFKILQAKKNIQRMRLERAILYERLSSIPPSPEMRGRHGLPPQAAHLTHPPPPLVVPQQTGAHAREAFEHARPVGLNDYSDYGRNEAPRLVSMQESRPAPAPEVIMGPGVAPPSHRHSRHDSGSMRDSPRQLPPLPPLQLEQPLAHGHGHHHSSHSHSGSRSDSRSHSRSRGHQELPPPQIHPSGPGQPPQLAIDALPPLHHALQGAELSPDRESARRYEAQELAMLHSLGHSRTPPQLELHSPILTAPEGQLPSPSSSRGASGHLHNHQRVGPGAHINRMHRRRESEREWERDREHDVGRDGPTPRVPTPPYAVRHRQSREREGDDRGYLPTSRLRGEHADHDMPDRLGSRGGSGSGSPASAGARASVGASLSRPASQVPEVSHERHRSYPHRGGNPPVLDPEQERGPALEDHSVRSSGVSRKRSREDMEVDSDIGGEASRGTGESRDARNSGFASDDRKAKRVHPDNGSPGGEDSAMD